MVLSLIPSSIYVYHLCFESVATATFFLFFPFFFFSKDSLVNILTLLKLPMF